MQNTEEVGKLTKTPQMNLHTMPYYLARWHAWHRLLWQAAETNIRQQHCVKQVFCSEVEVDFEEERSQEEAGDDAVEEVLTKELDQRVQLSSSAVNETKRASKPSRIGKFLELCLAYGTPSCHNFLISSRRRRPSSNFGFLLVGKDWLVSAQQVQPRQTHPRQ
eukprot:1849718-Amphidinium_carterae.1